MPCFNCKHFRNGKGKNKERLAGEKGYCEFWNQEFWQGYECRKFAPKWYCFGKKRISSLSEEKGGFSNPFGREKARSSLSPEEEPDLRIALSDLFESDAFDVGFDDGCDDDYNSQASRKLCAKVRRNIKIDGSVFNKYGLNFEYKLVVDCDILQLDFELSNTRTLAKKMSCDDDFTLKADVYDEKGELLYVEEAWVECTDLESGYVEDSIYFTGELMDRANSIKIYAIDPIGDFDGDEDIDESCEPAQSAAADYAAKLLIANRYNTILNDSLELLKTTYNPQVFFGRYKDSLDFAKKIAEESPVTSHREVAREILSDLTTNREAKIKAFIDRCYDAGRLYAIKDELEKYGISDEVMGYAISLLQKIEMIDDVPESGEYIYCSLSFGGGGKNYYYKTTDETIKVGDDVIVLTGASGKKNIATVVKVEHFKVGETPYPPNATKDIIGKCSFYK